MDKTVPEAAARLLDFISGPESGGNYEAISSFKQAKLPKKLTSMTVDEVLRDGRGWMKKYGTLSSAAGRYQIIYKTLLNLKNVMGLTGKEKFSPNLQDRMGYQLLRFRGYDAFMAGKMSVEAFGKALAQEWASMPVLAGTKNYKGINIKRGTSYYAGDGLNSHGTSAAKLENVIRASKTDASVERVIHATEQAPTPAVNLEDELTKVQTQCTASTNVKAADSTFTQVTKIGGAAATTGVILTSAPEAIKTVTDWQPLIESATALTKYGPYVLAAVVVCIVVAVIGRKIWRA